MAVVVELDPSLPAPAHSTHPPAGVYRSAGLVVAVVLLLTLCGAAPVASSMWRPLGSIPLPAEGNVAFSGNRVVTIGNAVQSREVSAWQIEPTRRLWTTTVGVAAPDDPFAIISGVRIEGRTVLLWLPDRSTAVLDLRTGHTLFTMPTRVEVVAPGVGLTRKTVFRPGTEYDPNSRATGPFYTSEDGKTYREPPQRTELYGIDLATGRVLWQLPLHGLALKNVAGAAMLIVTADRISVLDPATGRITAERTTSGGTWAKVSDGVALVLDHNRATAYDTTTLTPRWTSPAGPFLSNTTTTAPCENVICRYGKDSVEVVDPATGVTVWQTERETGLRRVGHHVVEYDADSQRPLRLVDASTGRLSADLRSWQSLALTNTGEPLLTRIEPGATRMSFAVLRTGRIQPLGYEQTIVRDCEAQSGLALCRDNRGLRLFAYHAPR